MSEKSVIEQALGEQWRRLHPLIKRHYDIVPGRDEQRRMQGRMDEVRHSTAAKLFLIPGRLLGALVHRRGCDVPVEVSNTTRADNGDAMFWHRTFYFPGKRPLHFRSCMVYAGDQPIIEYVRFGVGLRLRISEQAGALRFESAGYVWKVGPLLLALPGSWILGHAVIEERAMNENEFYVDFEMRHLWLGCLFAYRGRFCLEDSGLPLEEA